MCLNLIKESNLALKELDYNLLGRKENEENKKDFIFHHINSYDT